MRRLLLLVLIACLVLLASPSPSSIAQQTFTERVELNVVNVEVFVTDKVPRAADRAPNDHGDFGPAHCRVRPHLFRELCRRDPRQPLPHHPGDRVGGASMSGLPGRKALLYVSDGLPLRPGHRLNEYLFQFGDAWPILG